MYDELLVRWGPCCAWRGPVVKREARGAEAPGGEVGRLAKASRLQVSGHNRWSVQLSRAATIFVLPRAPSTVDTLTLQNMTLDLSSVYSVYVFEQSSSIVNICLSEL